MEILSLYIGFAALAGLAAGYATARIGRGWMIAALWAVTACLAVGYVLWLDSGAGPGGAQSAIIFYGIIMPFAACVVIATVMGTIVRRLRGLEE